MRKGFFRINLLNTLILIEGTIFLSLLISNHGDVNKTTIDWIQLNKKIIETIFNNLQALFS